MANVLKQRIAILACIFLGGLLAVIATAGKEWQKFKKSKNREFRMYYEYFRNPEEFILGYKTGLWEYCKTEEDDRGAARTRCISVNDKLRKYEHSMKGNYFCI